MIHAVMVFVISWLMGTLLGFWLGNSARDPARLGAAANVLHFLLILLPPVYYPVSVLPEWASHLALLVPTASLSHVLSYQLALAQSPHVLIPISILILYSLAFSLLATKYSQWSER
jgi:ABC-2 type transport system permease protein